MAYVWKVGVREIRWGKSFEADEWIAEQNLGTDKPRIISDGDVADNWSLRPGIYRAKDIVREASTLLASIDARLGDDSNVPALVANLRSLLAIEGREAALRLGSFPEGGGAQRALVRQAQRIGDTIADWAEEFARNDRSLTRQDRDVLSKYYVRSRCESHLWSYDVVSILTGPAGGPEVMQLFNEYLHQLLLLRDALLPFANWQEVLFDYREAPSPLNLKYTEQARKQFLVELLLNQPSHQDIARYAQAVLAPSLHANPGYGFQYSLGTILPAAFDAVSNENSNDESIVDSLHLLRWHPVWTILPSSSDANPEAIAFACALEEYETAPRTSVEHIGRSSSESAIPEVDEVELLPLAGTSEFSATIILVVRIGEQSYKSDLGQAARGLRYAYRPRRGTSAEPQELQGTPTLPYTRLEALSLFESPGLVHAEDGRYVIETGGNAVLACAALGKLYPGNIVLANGNDPSDLAEAFSSGKSFGGKFVLLHSAALLNG